MVDDLIYLDSGESTLRGRRGRSDTPMAPSISIIFAFEGRMTECFTPGIYRSQCPRLSDLIIPEKLNWTTSFQVLAPTVKMSVDMMDSRSTSLTSFHIWTKESEILKRARKCCHYTVR